MSGLELTPFQKVEIRNAKPGIPITRPEPREIPDFPSPLPEKVPAKPEPVTVPVKPEKIPAKV